MKNVCYLEKSHVVATIMETKSKYLNEKYVTMKECNIVAQQLIRILKEKKLDVCITEEINDNYFLVLDDIILKNKEITLETIKNKYTRTIPSIEVMSIIWNEKIIIDLLNIINFETENLLKIIDRILIMPDVFYEEIAQQLSKEEYNYLKEQIVNKTCINCAHGCIDTVNNSCSYWSNDELVGRQKIICK